VGYRRYIIFLSVGTLLFLTSGARGLDVHSIQLVGNGNGFTCEPADTSSNMEQVDDHLWRKLMFINEPGDPDTVFFKFTANGSYLPKHWGWSGVWGIAEYDYSPPNIGAILADSGYYYFYFNDTSYAYALEQPTGRIEGEVHSNPPVGVPDGTCITLYDPLGEMVGSCTSFMDSCFCFVSLPPAVYSMHAGAPGYRDTTIGTLEIGDGETETVSITLTSITAVTIASAYAERVAGGVLLTWSTTCCRHRAGFDVYRGSCGLLEAMEKRNTVPVYPEGSYRFFDSCDDPAEDLYYFIVEHDPKDPSRYGPIKVTGITPQITSALGQNYPNPFNPATTIPFTVGPSDEGMPVTVSFFDVSGRLVDTFDLGSKPAGEHAFRWNPALSGRGDIHSGVYYCRLRIGKETFTRKLILLR
jgi:hypothetical protein